MLNIRNMSYYIGKIPLVRDVSLDVHEGELVVLVGANGAGKTTMLRLIAGELRPSAGQISIRGRQLDRYRMRDLALERAVMRQHIYMSFDFTTYEVVMMGRHPHIRSGETQTDRQVVSDVLDKTETTHLSDQFYATLSGGEKARVTLARVLAQQTPILLLDEPTGAMDLRHQQLTMQLARAVADEGGAVLAVLHDLNLAAMYADRMGLMQHGELVALGEPRAVLNAENIQSVFNLPVHIMEHPNQKCPLIVPLMPQL